MAFLPFERYNIFTQLSIDEIRERLDLNIEPTKPFTLFPSESNNDAMYEGSVYGNQFSMQRKIGYRNSFNPQIKGTIITEEKSNHIHIVMTMHPAVMIFMGIWLSGALFAAVAAFISELQKEHFEPATLLVLLFFVFGYCLATGGFKYESNKSKRFLDQLFDVDSN